MNEADGQINDLEYKEAKNNHRTTRKKRIQKNEDSINSLWDNFKRSNIRLRGVLGREEKEQEIGHLSERKVRQNFPNLVKEIDIQVQEAQRDPKKLDPKRTTPRTYHN